MSVAIRFLMGEFDDYLRWPFPGGIFTITAVSSNTLICDKTINLNVTGNNTLQIRSRQRENVLSVMRFDGTCFLIIAEIFLISLIMTDSR